MIFYFSGTGNSQWVASELSKAFNEEMISIGKNIEKPVFALKENERIGFCFPIHSWGIPSIVVKFIQQLKMDNYQQQPVFAVATCGDNCGLSNQQFSHLMHQKGWQYHNFYSVQMPNNYIVMAGFNIDSIEVQQAKKDQARQLLPTIITAIRDHQPLKHYSQGSFAWFKSKIIYPGFCKSISDKSFYVTDSCTGCGACERFCPIQNIEMQHGKPHWNGHCTQCLSCIHRCPHQAIQYGKLTLKKGRYHFSE